LHFKAIIVKYKNQRIIEKIARKKNFEFTYLKNFKRGLKNKFKPMMTQHSFFYD